MVHLVDHIICHPIIHWMTYDMSSKKHLTCQNNANLADFYYHLVSVCNSEATILAKPVFVILYGFSKTQYRFLINKLHAKIFGRQWLILCCV